jgi:hypothetical protein
MSEIKNLGRGGTSLTYSTLITSMDSRFDRYGADKVVCAIRERVLVPVLLVARRGIGGNIKDSISNITQMDT